MKMYIKKLLCIVLILCLLPTELFTFNISAEDLQLITSVEITVNELSNRCSVSVYAGDTKVTGSRGSGSVVNINYLNYSDGTANYSVTISNTYASSYSFSDSVAVSVNGNSLSSFELHESKKSILIHYTPSTNWIDLYDGDNIITSLDFGTVDKSVICDVLKTVTIKNSSTYSSTGQMNITFQAKSSASGSSSDSSAGSSADSGSGSFIPFCITDGGNISSYKTINSIDANGEASFQIGIYDTDEGTYEATMNIMSTGMNAFNIYPINKSYDLTLTVTENKKVTLYINDVEQSNGTNIDFGTVDVEDDFSKTIKLKNTGNETLTDISLSFVQYPSEIFSVNIPSDPFSLEPNEDKTITLTLKSDATPGSYDNVSGSYFLNYETSDKSINGGVSFSITVTAPDPYSINAYLEDQLLTESYTVNHGSAPEDYSASDFAKTITVKNTGANATGNLNITLDGSNSDAFTVSDSSIASIAKNGESSFTIQPKANLSPGTYTSNIFVYNDNVSAEFKLSFTVQGVQTISSVTAPGKTAPAVDGVINLAGSAADAYMISYSYQEKSGDDWAETTSLVFMAGKQYRLKVSATVKSADYIFANNAAMTIGGTAAENAEVTNSGMMITGYLTYEALGQKAYSIELTCNSDAYNSESGILILPTCEEGSIDPNGVTFTITNLGSNATGEFTISQFYYNSYQDKETTTPDSVFNISPASISSIPTGESAQFTVSRPQDAEYSNGQANVVTLKIYNSNFETLSIRVSHTITQKQTYEGSLSYIHTISSSGQTSEVVYLDETDSFVFDYNYLPQEDQARYGLLSENYSSTEAERYTLNLMFKKSGTMNLSNIHVSHSGDGDEYFTFGSYNEYTESLSNIGQILISVMPAVGAPAGTHKTKLIITADNMDPYVVSLSFTVHKRIDVMNIKGVTAPAEGVKPSRRIYTDTVGAYITLYGWSRYDSGKKAWVGMGPDDTFKAGETYRLNIHGAAMTGYRFKNHFDENDIPSGSPVAQMGIVREIVSVENYDDWDVTEKLGYITSHQNYTGDRFYYYIEFTVKQGNLSGSASISCEEFLDGYLFETSYQTDNLEYDNSFIFTWYKDGEKIDGVELSRYYISKDTDISGNYYCVITSGDREGSITSSTFTYDSTKQYAPNSYAVAVNDPECCTGKGTVKWYRNNMEYRFALSTEDVNATYDDWQDATVESQETPGTTAGGDGGGTGGTSISYYGELADVTGGSVIWVRYKATETKSASDISIFTVAKYDHLLNHHEAYVPDISCACEENGMEEYFECTYCHKYFDADGNEFPSTSYFTTYATGHKDADGDFTCDYCGASLVSKYFTKVTSEEDLTFGARYIIADAEGNVMGKIENINMNDGLYVSAEQISRTQDDIDNNRYALFNTNQTDAFIFQLRSIPSKSTAGKTCYGVYLNDCCIDITNGLVLEQQDWDERSGISIAIGNNGIVTLESWDGENTLKAAKLTDGDTPVFTLNAGSNGIGEGNDIYLYRLIEESKTVDDKNYSLTEKDADADYALLKEQFGEGGSSCDVAAAKSVVYGINDALDENYINVLTKKAMKEEADEASDLNMSVKTSVEVTAASDDEITMDITPKITCGDTTVDIKDKYFNGNSMVLTLYAGKAVPESITHHLESGDDEIFYRVAPTDNDKTFRYETDENEDVYVTLYVSEFSSFTLSGEGIGKGSSGGGDNGYTVIWKSWDGIDILETDSNVVSGSDPSFDSAEPTKDADASYTYTFAGWALSANQSEGVSVDNLSKVTGDIIYYAAFSTSPNSSGGGESGGIIAEIENNILTVSFDFTSGYVYAAEYKNGKMLHLQMQIISSVKPYVFSVYDSGNDIVCYVVDESYIPLSEKISPEVKM